MKKFAFRLEGVLRVRRVQRDQARAALAHANLLVNKASARVDQRRERYATLARPAGVQSYAAVERTLAELDTSAGAIGWASSELGQAQAAAAARHAVWAEAEQRVRTLERLRSHAKAEHVAQERRDDARNADDIATTRYRKRAMSV